MVRLSRKGVFFTFVAVLLLGAVIFSFSVYSRYSLKTKSLVIDARISTMNSFIKDIDDDIVRGTFIASHRSLLSLVEYISSTGQYSDDVQSDFLELFLNGSIGNESQALMNGTTFTDWTEKMNLQADKININIDFDVANITVNQSDHWIVDVHIGVNVSATDSLEIAEWNVARDLVAQVGIQGFEDPVYAVNTGGLVLNTINMTPYTDFVSGNDTTNLRRHVNNSYYVEWSTAPSFLMRLEGNMSSSPYGIESLVDLQKLLDLGYEIDTKSAVDHVYWSDKNLTSYSIENMPEWFRMDSQNNPDENMNHLELYEVEDLT